MTSHAQIHTLRPGARRALAAALPLAVALCLDAGTAGAAAGTLATNMDTINNFVDVYAIPQGSTDITEYSFNGTWSQTNLMTKTGAPAATPGSPITAYENTVNRDPELFYLSPAPNGASFVSQLYTVFWFPGNITQSTGALPAGPGSGLVGYMDTFLGSDNVFYQGTDGYIHVLVWTSSGGWAEDTSINRTTAAAPSSALTGHLTGNSQELFFIGANRHVYELWRYSPVSDGWHLTDVTEANGAKTLAKTGSPLAGFYDPVAGNDAVFYIGTDKHLHELLFTHSVWQGIDVTAASGTPAPSAGSTLSAHLNTSANSEEVFYEEANHSLGVVFTFSTSTPTWAGYDLFAGQALHAPRAIAASALATDMDSAIGLPLVDELYYFDATGTVREVYSSSNSGGWVSATP